MTEATTVQDLQLLKESLVNLPEPAARAVLVVVSGLPGTGKSSLGRQLAQRVSLAILETDALRKTLFPEPTYSAGESTRLFKATHLLIEDLLKQGISVLLDATNLVEGHRERLYNIADRLGAKLIIIRVEAPPQMVKERLDEKEEGLAEERSHSSADWQVYQRMKPSSQPIRRNHFAVDTSQDITPALDKVVREIHRWMRGKG